MKIYIACHSKELANEAAEELRNVNHEIVSTWHDGEFKSTNKYTFEERAEKAQRDYDQIKECDLLMLISGSDRYAGGKFVEAGIAIGIGKEVAIIGHRENLVLCLSSIGEFKSVGAWIDNDCL